MQIKNHKIVQEAKNGKDLVIEFNDNTLEIVVPKGTEIARMTYNVKKSDIYTQADLYIIGDYVIKNIMGVDVTKEVIDRNEK